MKQISQKEKDSLNRYLNLMNINISKTSDKNEVFKFLKIKLRFSIKTIKELNMDGESLFLLDEEEIDKFEKIKKDELIKLKQLLKKVKKPKEGVQKMNHKSKYNVFFPLCIKEEYIKNISIITYEKIGYHSKKNLENDIIHIADYTSTKEEKLKFYIYHIYSNTKITNLQIVIKEKHKNYENENESKIEIRKGNEIFFLIDNIFYGKTLNFFFCLQISTIIKEYISYFFNERNNTIDNKFKTYLLKAFINKIKSLSQFDLSAQLILKLIKLCFEFKLDPEKMDNLQLEKIKGNDKIILDEKYYISKKDLDKVGMKRNKSKIMILLL